MPRGEDSCAGIALLPGRIPEGFIGCRPDRLHVAGLGPDFLKAEHVRFLLGQESTEIPAKDRPKAVDVPGDYLHRGNYSNLPEIFPFRAMTISRSSAFIVLRRR